MSDNEKKISEYIDSLNAEKKPGEHDESVNSSELEEIMSTVRMIKSLKEPSMPDSNYQKKLSKAIAGKMSPKVEIKRQRKPWYVAFTAVAAAAVIIVFALSFTSSFGRNNIIYAMEQAFQEVKAYHGLLEIIETNAEGKDTIQAKLEVWADKQGRYYIREVEGSQAGLTTVNNGERKWQIRPDSNQVHIFSAFPDPYRFTFELGEEVKDIKNAIKTKKIGEEQITGREAVVLEVSPQGGTPYKLWIDKETKLPLKKQSSMLNALQYTVTYTDIDFYDAVPAELIAYKLPAGFEEISINTEQLVNSLEEANEIAGFTAVEPDNIPAGYVSDAIAVELDEKLVKLFYINMDKQKMVLVVQGKAKGEFKPAPTAILGKINDNAVEIQPSIEGKQGILTVGGAYAGITSIGSVRWQEGELEYTIIGNASVEELGMFAKGIAKVDVQISSTDDESAYKPQIEVPVDLTIVENEQKSVDEGHSPWKLDPVFVAQVFVSLKISPEGIVGDYPIDYENLKVVQNTGTDAVISVEDEKSPVSKVYLKRLIRQDQTGIWTVVGYDPANKN